MTSILSDQLRRVDGMGCEPDFTSIPRDFRWSLSVLLDQCVDPDQGKNRTRRPRSCIGVAHGARISRGM